MFRSFCKQHNLTPVRNVYRDKGKSGFHGEHIQEGGELRQLIDAAKSGAFEQGSVIVVEAWDRLGRLIPDEQVALLSELLRTGVDIGVCRLGDIFTAADFGSYKWAGLATFIMIAYQESLQKSDRIKAVWQKKRQAAREGTKVNCRIPCWLQLKDGQFQVLEDKAAAVRRLFQLAADGYGQGRIVRKMIEEGRPTIHRKKWSNGFVARLLNDRRALGEITFTKDGKAEGKPVEGYYPAIVTPEQFALARAGQEGRKGKQGSRDRKHVNIFGEWLKDAKGDKHFYLHTKGEKRRVLVNLDGRHGHSAMRTIPYDGFEEIILSHLSEINPASILPSSGSEQSAIETLRADLAAIRGQLAEFQAELRRKFSRTVSDICSELEIKEEAAARSLQDALEKAARPTDRQWEKLPGLAAAVKEGGDIVRLKLRTILRSIIEEGRLLLVRNGSAIVAACQLWFTGGGVRHYLTIYKPAARFRQAQWWPLDFKSTGLAALPDLRRADHVRRLEAALEKLDHGSVQ
jgi:DNA invertase Pin-like site-specific DNA recombinase